MRDGRWLSTSRRFERSAFRQSSRRLSRRWSFLALLVRRAAGIGHSFGCSGGCRCYGRYEIDQLALTCSCDRKMTEIPVLLRNVLQASVKILRVWNRAADAVGYVIIEQTANIGRN